MINKKILSGKEAADALDSEEGKYALELTRNLIGGFQSDCRNLMGPSAEAEIDWEPIQERYSKSVDGIKDKGHMLVITHDEKPVGMQGYKRIGTDPNTGREVIELSHGSILEEARGQGYIKELANIAIEQIVENFDDVDIVFGSINLEFAELLASGLQFDPISLEHYYQIQHSTEDISAFTEEIENKRNTVQYYLMSAK